MIGRVFWPLRGSWRRDISIVVFMGLLLPLVLAVSADAQSVVHYLPYPAGVTATHTAGPGGSAGVHSSVYDKYAHDFVIPGGKVLASAPGSVLEAEWHEQLGNQVIVKHADGTCSRYAHMSSLTVSRGQKVGQGAQLGVQGSTGSTPTGSHLHFTRIDCTTEYSLTVTFAESPSWKSQNGSSAPQRVTVTRDDPKLYGNSAGWRSYNVCNKTHECDSKWTDAIPGQPRDNYAVWDFGKVSGRYQLQCYIPHDNAWATVKYEVFKGSSTVATPSLYQGDKYGWTTIGTYDFGSSQVAKVRAADNLASKALDHMGVDACRLKPA